MQTNLTPHLKIVYDSLQLRGGSFTFIKDDVDVSKLTKFVTSIIKNYRKTTDPSINFDNEGFTGVLDKKDLVCAFVFNSLSGTKVNPPLVLGVTLTKGGTDQELIAALVDEFQYSMNKKKRTTPGKLDLLKQKLKEKLSPTSLLNSAAAGVNYVNTIRPQTF